MAPALRMYANKKLYDHFLGSTEGVNYVDWNLLYRLLVNVNFLLQANRVQMAKIKKELHLRTSLIFQLPL
jgi:hypothetical protein